MKKLLFILLSLLCYYSNASYFRNIINDGDGGIILYNIYPANIVKYDIQSHQFESIGDISAYKYENILPPILTLHDNILYITVGHDLLKYVNNEWVLISAAPGTIRQIAFVADKIYAITTGNHLYDCTESCTSIAVPDNVFTITTIGSYNNALLMGTQIKIRDSKKDYGSLFQLKGESFDEISYPETHNLTYIVSMLEINNKLYVNQSDASIYEYSNNIWNELADYVGGTYTQLTSYNNILYLNDAYMAEIDYYYDGELNYVTKTNLPNRHWATAIAVENPHSIYAISEYDTSPILYHYDGQYWESIAY